MITEQQIQTFEQDGAVTIDSPLTGRQLAAASDLTDRLLPLGELKDGERIRYRVGKNNLLDPPFVQIIEHPFFEQVTNRLLQADHAVVIGTALRKTHPQPGAKFEVGEHTDITYSLADMASVPRRMDISFFLWLSDVDGKCAPLIYRPGSHRLIAQHMGDRPRYVHGPFDPDDYRNVPDIHTLPVGSAAHREHWPDLEYAKLVPCIARAGQVTVINQAAIHSASTNRGMTSRKSLIIGFRPHNIVMGERKAGLEIRRQYLRDLKNQLSPNRRHLVPGDL